MKRIVFMSKKIIVIYPSGKLGDFLWHVPFFEHISKISNQKVIILTRRSTGAKDLILNESFVDSIYYFEFKKGFINYFMEIFRMRNLFKKLNVGQVWILDKISRPAIAAKIAKIDKVYGYGAGNQSFWITNEAKLTKKDLEIHYINRANKFFKKIGYPLEYKFTNLKIDKNLLNQFTKLTSSGKKIIVYGIDSSEMWRSWPQEYFSNLINFINKSFDVEHVLIAGPWNSHLAEKVIANTKKNNVHNFSHLKISSVAAILKVSDFFIGNDSGILNLSAALGTKSIGIFNATKPFNYSVNIIPVISKGGEILYSKGKNIKDPDLAKTVKVEDVYLMFKDKFKFNNYE